MHARWLTRSRLWCAIQARHRDTALRHVTGSSLTPDRDGGPDAAGLRPGVRRSRSSAQQGALMCGISGYWGSDQRIAAQLAPSLDTLHHRGPNDRGTHVTTDVSMRMTRLSVIDLEGARQPVYNEDGSIAVVFNGEIYNYRELMR